MTDQRPPARTPAVRVGPCLPALLAGLLWGALEARAQEQDLGDLSLEELMAVEIKYLESLDISHVHRKGEWMVGLSSMTMEMIGNRDGTNRLRRSEVLQTYMVTPTRMSMQMHMLEVMHAPLADLTLMAMLPHVRKEMDHLTQMGEKFTAESEGLGDARLSALYSLYRGAPHLVHLDLGVSFPTGSVDAEDDTPAGPDQKLPYPMQLGSGTFDFLPGIAYIGQSHRWAWGAVAAATLRTGENGEEYRLGNRWRATAWAGRRFGDWASAFARLQFEAWDDIHGQDPELDPMMEPTADPERRGGRSLDLFLGVHLFQDAGPLKGVRLSMEAGVPLYQSLDGPQLERDLTIGLSARWTF